MLRVGWLSAPASAVTGYGKITLEICSRLVDMGYEVVNIGGRGTVVTWGEKLWVNTEKGNGFLVLPCWGQVGDRGIIEYYIQRYGLEVLISLWDSFVLPAIERPSIPWVAYCPFDAKITRKWAGDLMNADLIVAYSHFGYNELLKHFPDFMVRYIPHAVNAKEVFKPRSEEEKPQLRDKWNIPRDDFLVLFVGTNMGERKNIPQLMLTFKRFVEKHPDSDLYLFTNLAQYPSGYNIIGFAEELGIQKKVMMPRFNTILDSVEDKELAELYACADVTVNATLGEGFGMSVLESMACGVPVIATNNSSMTELVQGHGWLVDTVPEETWIDIPCWIPTLQRFNPPNLGSLLKCLEEAYENTDLRKEYGRNSRDFAVKNYDWSELMPKWDALIKEMVKK